VRLEPKETTNALLARRWPTVGRWLRDASIPPRTELVDHLPAPTLSIEGIRVSSAYDPLSEAELQARLVPIGTREATIYGLGNGALARHLLDRPELESLRVVLLNPAVAAACLAVFDVDDWLDDPRVELLRGEDELELIPPFAALPACLKLASPEAARIRDLVELELATPYIGRHIRARESVLRDHLCANRLRLRTDGDVSELFDTRRGETVLVAAAGPTLSDHFERLRAIRRDRLLIAVDAALQPLLGAGIRPQVVVAADSHELGLSRIFEVDPDDLEGMLLAYDPVVHPPVLERWPGRRLAFYRDHPRYAALRDEQPKADLWTSGSVLHAAVDLAVRAGASRVELLGADFANLHGRSHVSGAAWERSVGARRGREHWLANGRGERVPTQPNLIGYLRDLERYVARHPDVTFVQTSPESAAIAGAIPGEHAA